MLKLGDWKLFGIISSKEILLKSISKFFFVWIKFGISLIDFFKNGALAYY